MGTWEKYESKKIQKQHLLLLIDFLFMFSLPNNNNSKTTFVTVNQMGTWEKYESKKIQKQHLLLLIKSFKRTTMSITYSKTTFVTVNLWLPEPGDYVKCYSKTTFVTVNQNLINQLVSPLFLFKNNICYC